MRLRLLFACAMVAAGPVVAAQPAAAQAQRDWSQVVARTPEGGFRMGNPNAPVHLVWFMSLTCQHCAHFAAEGAPELVRNYVRNGRVSFEYRNFVLNAYDLAATFISRCAAPRDYFPLSHAILASQAEWTARIENLSLAQHRQLLEMPPIDAMPRIVEAAGLDRIAARHGISASEARACLADEAALARIAELRRAGLQLGVTGTPSFTINGRLADDVHNWQLLEPLVRAALRTT